MKRAHHVQYNVNQDTIVWGEVTLIGVQNHHKIGMLQILSCSVGGTCTSSVYSAFSVYVSRHGVAGRSVQIAPKSSYSTQSVTSCITGK